MAERRALAAHVTDLCHDGARSLAAGVPSTVEACRVPRSDVPMSDVSIALPDRYRVLNRIATGGMATVYRAEDGILGREVAVKILAPHVAADPISRAALRARGADGGARRRPPERRHDLRHRRGGRATPSSSWSSTGAGRSPTGCARATTVPRKQALGVAERGRRGPRLRALPRGRPPRRQAREPAARRERAPRRRRLRDRPAGRRVVADPGGHRARHRRLPVAGAGDRRAARPPPRTATRWAASPSSC